ncbi:MAG: hypothetical protein ACI9P5_000166 [Saprospiraceae bacterium]|jgi:hypothetical protein
MKTLIEDLNRKTDNRFVYAIGIFCLLSICLSHFPEAKQKAEIMKNEIIIASNLTSPDPNHQLYNIK